MGSDLSRAAVEVGKYWRVPVSMMIRRETIGKGWRFRQTALSIWLIRLRSTGCLKTRLWGNSKQDLPHQSWFHGFLIRLRTQIRSLFSQYITLFVSETESIRHTFLRLASRRGPEQLRVRYFYRVPNLGMCLLNMCWMPTVRGL